jgi:hypothetical protein
MSHKKDKYVHAYDVVPNQRELNPHNKIQEPLLLRYTASPCPLLYSNLRLDRHDLLVFILELMCHLCNSPNNVVGNVNSVTAEIYQRDFPSSYGNMSKS